MPHALEGGFDHCQQGAITGEPVAGHEELQRFPRGLLGFPAESAELFVIKFFEPNLDCIFSGGGLTVDRRRCWG